MSILPNTDRSDSRSNTSGEGWNIEPNNGTKLSKEQIKLANSIPILTLLQLYGLSVNSETKHILCPFSSRHRGGQDKSPSFTIYTNTNSFWCFGCQTGTSPIDFVSNIENIGFIAAYNKIVSLNSNSSVDFTHTAIDFNKRTEIMMKFSSFIRNQMAYGNTSNVEEICQIFDTLCAKYRKILTNEMLTSIITKLQDKLQ